MKYVGSIFTLVVVFAFVTQLCACSAYTQFEDSLKENISSNGGVSPDQDGQNVEHAEENSDNTTSVSEDVNRIGDTITHAYSNGLLSYTLKSVKRCSNLAESGLAETDFVEGIVNTDGTFGNIDDILLLVTLHIANVDYEDAESAETDYPIYIESCIGTKPDIEDPDGPWLIYASYFSEHPENDLKSYYFYDLEPGAEIDVQIGWIVAESKLEEPMYYVIGMDDHYTEADYFQLN